MSTDQPVNDLVIRARNGDKQAWDTLVERYAPLIWSICRRHRLDHADAEASVFIELEDSFERYALLRHFLHRCLTKGVLADAELDLLIQFKLDGNSGEELAALNGSSSNAVRQRFKRLLAKLRRLAR